MLSSPKSRRRILNKAKSFRWSSKIQWMKTGLIYIAVILPHAIVQARCTHLKRVSTIFSKWWLTTKFMHILRYETDLVGIAVTDVMSHTAQCVYTFFKSRYRYIHTDSRRFVPNQLLRKNTNIGYILGYQIDECPAMNYRSTISTSSKASKSAVARGRIRCNFIFDFDGTVNRWKPPSFERGLDG